MTIVRTVGTISHSNVVEYSFLQKSFMSYSQFVFVLIANICNSYFQGAYRTARNALMPMTAGSVSQELPNLLSDFIHLV